MSLVTAGFCLLCFCFFFGTGAAAPVGQSTVALNESAVESRNTEGSSFPLSPRTRINISASVIAGVFFFVYLVAPTLLKFLREQDRLRKETELGVREYLALRLDCVRFPFQLEEVAIKLMLPAIHTSSVVLRHCAQNSFEPMKKPVGVGEPTA